MLALLGIGLLSPSRSADAAPGSSAPVMQVSQQIPDWLSPESASRLNVGIDVLAPSYVPGPFSGEPEIKASDGYYSFYWLVPGAPPTFLTVTGSYGDSVPDFSYYDRNVELVQNETVMGYPAWHDVSPIYDVVYWMMGDVLYSIESHNLVGDDTMSIANSLMYVVPDSTGGEDASIDEPPAVETPVTDAEPTQAPAPTEAARVFTIGAPAAVQSNDVASIGVSGSGDVLLTATDGYFVATGETTVVVSGGVSVDWQAPYSDADQQITFAVLDLDSGEQLASQSIALEGYVSEGESVVLDLQCPAEASSGKQARFAITGNGTIVLTASDGSFPAESQNLVFAADADGGATIAGTLSDGQTLPLLWLAPLTPETASISASDLSGNLLDQCAVSVTTAAGAGDLGAPASDSVGGSPGDGTGVVNVDPSIVSRAIANPSGFAGDASGGPEANGADYGLPGEEIGSQPDQTTPNPEEDAAREPEQAELVPTVGENGLIAIELGSEGGKLADPDGATIRIPAGAIDDATTVMLQSVPDLELPQISGVSMIPGTGFSVAFSDPAGQAIDELSKPATLTLALKSAPNNEGARIYQITGDRAKPLALVNEDSGSLTSEIEEVSRYAVGVPAPAVAGSTSSVNPFIIGGLGLIALLSAGMLISRGLTRRKARFVPVRRPVHSRVRYR